MATTITPPTSPNGAAAQQTMARPKSAIMRPSSRLRSTSRVSTSSRHGAATKLSDEEGKTAVKVAVRVRPQLKSDDPGFDLIPQRFRSSMVDVPSPASLTVESNHGKRLFVFDRVFNPDVDQEGVWEYVSESVSSFLQGYNVSVLAYGQSGAGKSYTMGTTGSSEQGDPRLMGIVPRAASALFEKLNPSVLAKSGIRSPNRYSLSAMTAISQAAKIADKDWKMTATYVEIYQEQLRDLLVDETIPFSDRPQVSIREDAKGRILLTGLKQVTINSIEELMDALNFGSTIRQTDSTAINARSSRSHAVFTINLVQKKGQATPVKEKRRSVPLEAFSGSENWITVDSKLHFVDLAGSERLKNTGAHGERAKEGISINAGLASLGKVISQLSSRHAAAHVSYRDSRLTRLLQDSLGGNAITYMVACVNPAEFHLSETLNTVTYAQRARAIQSKPQIQQINDDSDKQAVIERLRAEIQFLRDQIRLAERTERPAPQDRSERSHERDLELQNRLLDMQENYNALGQRHAKLIGEIAKARDGESGEMPILRETVGSSTLDRLKRSASFQESVESIVLEYEKTIETLEASLSNTRSTLSNSESTLLERETKIVYMETLNQQLQNRLQKSMDRENNDENYLRELESRVAGATSDEERSGTLITSLKKELTRIREGEVGAEDYISTLEERLAEAEQQHETLTREIDRLEHVVDRQRSINKLDNLLYELDHVRATDAKTRDATKTNGHSGDRDDTDSFHSFTGSDVQDAEVNGVFVPPRKSAIRAFNGQSLGGAVRELDEEDEDQDPDTPVPHVQKSLQAAEETDGPSPAQTKFVNDKLETVTQELFDLRVEHDGTISEIDELHQKYQLALTSMAELQDALEDARRGNLSRPMSRIAEGLLEEETPSLSTELQATDRDELEPQSAITATSQREEELLEENEQLKKRHAEAEDAVVELQGNLDQLQGKHHETLGQVEELKADLHKAKGVNGRASPVPGILRRKERTSVLSDRTNRSFAILRTLVLESIEGDDDKSQTFEHNLNLIVSDFHTRSERVVQLEAELGALRKEMDSKTALISGLTRERSSLKASPIDMLMTLETQLRESETQTQNLSKSHSAREQDLLEQIDHLKTSLDNAKSSDSSMTDSDYSRDSTVRDSTGEQVKVSQLQKEVTEWRTKHDSMAESMKASEKQLLAQISDLETNLKTVEHQASRSVSPEDMHHFEIEKQHNADKIARLRKEVADHKAATMLTTQRLAELQESHIKILEQVDRDNQAKSLTLRELDTHKTLVSNLESQITSHKESIESHQKALDSLKDSHSKELEASKTDSLRAQKESNEKLQAALEEHSAATAGLKAEIDKARAGSDSSKAILESELTKHKEQTAIILADAALILNKPTNMSNITAHIQALVNARKDIIALHETASNELRAMREELDSTHAGSGDYDRRLDELKEANDQLTKDLNAISEKEKKSIRLIEELEQQLESNYDQTQTKDAKTLEKLLEEAKEKITQLETDLVEVQSGNLERSSSGRSEHTNNIRKSTMPSPPPTIPLPPLPASSAGQPPPTPTTSAPAMSPPSSRHASKDMNTAQLVEDQEARIRTIEKHLFAEKQLTATLEEALTDLESSSTKMKADMEAWRRKCGILEEELLLMKREKQNTRLSVQQMEDEARRRIDLERAKLEERMQQLTNMSKKQKKKSSINCF